jgi:oleate hydratase
MTKPNRSLTKAHLIGGGIASLAAAAILIRDGDLLGHNITIYEETGRDGGALDAAGDPERGYSARGGRMIESKYLCTYDLFSSIPTLDLKQTVTQEIFAWNELIKTGSKSRLVRNGKKIDAPSFGLSEKHILTIEKLALVPEALLGTDMISEQFDAAFFQTDFWFMWCTTFAFQPWHSAVEFKRYLVRFTHMVGGFSELRGIMRTVYNQYDSLVLPLQKWLEQRGVAFRLNSKVIDIEFIEGAGTKFAASITCEHDGRSEQIAVKPYDLVIATLGSMTESSSVGSMDRAPVPVRNAKRDGGAWSLWEKLAQGRPELGRPGVFADRIEESKWVSFTVTLKDPSLFRFIRDLTGNVPGEGGLITFPDSAWLMSIVLPHQPHFIGQPEDVEVLWGYGLHVDATGNYVKKPMAACTGREILVELLGHLGVGAKADAILAHAISLPCLMPFITSQFLTRAKGDRPSVHPQDYANFGITGQFCEVPDDVVFTVEYSIRSAMAAVYSLLDLDKNPPAVFKGQYDPRNLYNAFRALHDIGQ